MKMIILSGTSGSGKTIALKSFEDLGSYCIDNLPVELLEPLVDHLSADKTRRDQVIAVGIDARNQIEGLSSFPSILQRLRDRDVDVELIFLRAEHSTLVKRFSETRRKHPLSADGLPLDEALDKEYALLDPIATDADLIIDTTNHTLHDLRDIVIRHMNTTGSDQIAVLLQSFGFKHGLPVDADFVFDVRCLPNPHWHKELRPQTGRDAPVCQFLETSNEVIALRDQIGDFLCNWIPQFGEENRTYLNISIGCTGGQHRSVYMVEKIGARLADIFPHVNVRHRELQQAGVDPNQ